MRRTLLVVIAVVSLAIVMPPGTVGAEGESPGCPPGFVSRPPEFEASLGPCIPAGVPASPLGDVLDPGDGCPPGFVSGAPQGAAAAGDDSCVPDVGAARVVIEIILWDGSCPLGWQFFPPWFCYRIVSVPSTSAAAVPSSPSGPAQLPVMPLVADAAAVADGGAVTVPYPVAPAVPEAPMVPAPDPPPAPEMPALSAVAMPGLP